MAREGDKGTLSPTAKLMEITWGFWASQLLLQAAQMRLADKFDGDARSATELCAEYGMHAPSFRRFLRTLAGMGILTTVGPERYALTAMGEALKTQAPGAACSATICMIEKLGGPAWANVEYSLRTGKPALEKHFGQPLFEYMGKTPELAQMFSDSMVGMHGQEPPAVAAAYDFSGMGSLVDVGGATGNMLAHILSRHAGVRGVLYDLPHVVAGAPPLLQSFGVTDRVDIQGGSFFESVPAGHDAYLMSHILHDWDDRMCATILGHCRKAMKPESKLLLVELVLSDDDAPDPGKLSDLMMLLGTGGLERTTSEYDALLSANGFRMTRIVPTASAVSVVEAVRV